VKKLIESRNVKGFGFVYFSDTQSNSKIKRINLEFWKRWHKIKQFKFYWFWQKSKQKGSTTQSKGIL